jgi:hypothetical protein
MTTLTTSAPVATETEVTTAVAVGIHRSHGDLRLLLRLPGGHRATSLPLNARDIDRLPSTARSARGVLHWFTPPLAVRVRRPASPHGLAFVGLAAVDEARAADHSRPARPDGAT